MNKDLRASITSGARYQRVATYSVICDVPSSGVESKPRLKPKSHILSSQSELTSRFPGLRSRCTTEAECTYFMPAYDQRGIRTKNKLIDAYTSQNLIRKILHVLIGQHLS